MRCTELMLTPAARAIAAPVQCVVSPGGAANVRPTTTRLATEGSSLGMRDGRVLSRKALETFRGEALLPAPDAGPRDWPLRGRSRPCPSPRPSGVRFAPARRASEARFVFVGRSRSAVVMARKWPASPRLARRDPAPNPVSDSIVRFDPLAPPSAPRATAAGRIWPTVQVVVLA